MKISSKLDSVKTSNQNKITESLNSSESKENSDKNFNITQIGNKVFAIKESKPGKYFCPKCHAQVSETSFSCSNCNKSLVAD